MNVNPFPVEPSAKLAMVVASFPEPRCVWVVGIFGIPGEEGGDSAASPTSLDCITSSKILIFSSMKEMVYSK